MGDLPDFLFLEKWSVPLQVQHRDTPNISKHLMFKFYEKVYYSVPTGLGEINKVIGH